MSIVFMLALALIIATVYKTRKSLIVVVGIIIITVALLSGCSNHAGMSPYEACEIENCRNN